MVCAMTTRTFAVAEAARLLHIHPQTLMARARAGAIPGCKVGKAWVFVESLLIEYLVAQSRSRVSVAGTQENPECRSTEEKTPRIGVKLPAIRGESGPLQVSTGTIEKRKAAEFHDRLKAERWDQGKLGSKPRRTWEEAVVKFLEETTHKRTHERDKSILRWLDGVLGGKHLDEIDRALVDQIKATRAKIATQSTANRYLAVIRTVLRKACHEWEWVERVPKVALFREKEGRIRSLTQEELGRLLANLPPHLADMALFSVATGLRQGNVRELEWSQVNLELRHAWITPDKHKNGRAHAVPLNEVALAVLTRQVGKHATHAFTYHGHPIANVSTKAWWKGLELAGIENFRWHDLRHTFATWHRQAGTPTHELQRLGGWKTLAMVERYAHVAPEGLQIAAGRLDNALQGYAMATPEKKRDRP
jgi:integrase